VKRLFIAWSFRLKNSVGQLTEACYNAAGGVGLDIAGICVSVPILIGLAAGASVCGACSSAELCMPVAKSPDSCACVCVRVCVYVVLVLACRC